MSGWKSAQKWLRKNGWVEDHGNPLAAIAVKYTNPALPGVILSGAESLNLWGGAVEGTGISAMFVASPEEALTKMRETAATQLVTLQEFLKIKDSGIA